MGYLPPYHGNVTRENDDELVVLAGPYFQREPDCVCNLKIR